MPLWTMPSRSSVDAKTVVLVILCRPSIGFTTHVVAVCVLTATALAGVYLHISLDFLGYSAGANLRMTWSQPDILKVGRRASRT